MAFGIERDKIAAWTDKTGLTRALGLLSRRSCLIVINFHRIGDASKTPYDPGTFSATAEQFDAQIAFLKARFPVLTLEEAIAGIHNPGRIRGPQVLLTFDDGYLDNYEQALPVLRAHGVQATFFLPTSYIGTNAIPWWDAIAYQIRTSQQPVLRLGYPAQTAIRIDGPEDRAKAVRTVLDMYKNPATDAGRFRAAIAAATGVDEPRSAPDRLFMNWEEVAGMLASGMAIGSHTHSHQLLSRMTAQEQRREFTVSRQLLEAHTGIRPDALAFPVGARTSIPPETCKLLQETGYRAGFSFYGGINLPGRTDPFNVCRIDGDLDRSRAYFELRMTLAAAAGRDLL